DAPGRGLGLRVKWACTGRRAIARTADHGQCRPSLSDRRRQPAIPAPRRMPSALLAAVEARRDMGSVDRGRRTGQGRPGDLHPSFMSAHDQQGAGLLDTLRVDVAALRRRGVDRERVEADLPAAWIAAALAETDAA